MGSVQGADLGAGSPLLVRHLQESSSMARLGFTSGGLSRAGSEAESESDSYLLGLPSGPFSSTCLPP